MTGQRGTPEIPPELDLPSAYDALIDEYSSPRQLRYIDGRFFIMVSGARKKRTQWRNVYYLVSALIAASAILTPSLISASAAGAHVTLVAFGSSLVLAMCEATRRVIKPGERWQLNVDYVAALAGEGWRAAMKVGRYASFQSNDGAFALFVSQIEAIHSTYNTNYSRTVAVLYNPEESKKKTDDT